VANVERDLLGQIINRDVANVNILQLAKEMIVRLDEAQQTILQLQSELAKLKAGPPKKEEKK